MTVSNRANDRAERGLPSQGRHAGATGRIDDPAVHVELIKRGKHVRRGSRFELAAANASRSLIIQTPGSPFATITDNEFRMRLQNKVAVITGAATGIGHAIAVRFAREGASVVVDYVGSPETPNRTEEEIKSFGGKTMAVAADVSKPAQVQNLVESTVKAL